MTSLLSCPHYVSGLIGECGLNAVEGRQMSPNVAMLTLCAMHAALPAQEFLMVYASHESSTPWSIRILTWWHEFLQAILILPCFALSFQKAVGFCFSLLVKIFAAYEAVPIPESQG